MRYAVGRRRALTALPTLFLAALIALAVACGGGETVREVTVVVEKPVEKVVKETVVVEKQVPVEKVVKETVVVKEQVPVEKVVKETVVVKEQVPVEKVVKETVVVEKQVPVEKVVKETVVVEKQVPVEKIVKETVVVEKEKLVEKLIEVPVTVVAVATPTPTPAGVQAAKPEGVVTAAISNVYFMNSSPRYCPACSVTARTGTVETLLEAARAPDGSIGIRPLLATKWTQSADGTSYTDFVLRDDVVFHQGWGKMTAKDVAFSWNDPNPNLQPDSIHDTGGDIGTILNNVEVLDDYTVRFNWKVFNGSTMLQYMTNFIEGIGIFSKDFFDAVGPEKMREKLIGTGPFEMVEWTQHKGAFMSALDHHWRKVPFVRLVNILEVPENSVRKAMLETGQVQIAGDIQLKDWADLFSKGLVQAPEAKLGDASYVYSGNYWSDKLYDGQPFTSDKPGDLLYRPKLEDKPWIGNPADADSMERAKKVRLALAMAIDRQALVDAFTGGLGKVSYAPGVQTADPLYKKEWDIPFDPAAAQALLADAGYPDGFDAQWWGGPQSGTGDSLVDGVAAMWLKHLNVKSTIDQQNYSSFRPSLVNRTNTKIFFSGGSAHVPPTWPRDLHATTLSRPGGYNRAMEIPKFEETYLAMSKELDQAKLVKLMQDMYDWNREWMVWVGVYQAPAAAIYDPNQIESWKMLPEGKGVLGMMNSLEWIKLKK